MVNATAYKYDISPHQALYMGGKGLMTIVTLQGSGPGQQQQSSQQFSTGKWAALPLLYVLSDRIIVVISTLQETYTLQIQKQDGQGSQTQMSTGAPSGALEALISQTHPSPLQPVDGMPPAMPPMEPMQPMGPMNMTMKPMSMNMGNMSMTMDSAAVSTSTSQSNSSHPVPNPDTTEPEQKVKRFCSQCGAGVQPSDRFCAYCGNAL